MDKSKSLKKSIIALSIFSLIAVVCWAVFFVVFGLTSKLLMPHIQQAFAMFTPWKLSDAYYLRNSIFVLVICGVVAVLLILLLVFCIKNKRAILVLPFCLLVVACLGVIEFVASLANYSLANTTEPTGYLYFLYGVGENKPAISSTIMVVAIAACAIIGAVIALIAYVLALVHTIKYPKNKKAAEEEPANQLAFEEEPAVEEKDRLGDEEFLEKLRLIIREELRALNAQPAVNFTSPLVVQYFNGVSPVAEEEEEVKQEPQPEPQPEPEPVVEEEVSPEPEPAPVVEEPAPEPVQEEEEAEKAKIIRIPFQERMLSADKEMLDNYNELKNEILSYGVKSRVSNSGDTFRLHRKTYVKLTIAGKSLKLYFALNPEDYKDSTIPVGDASDKNIYADIPLIFKVKSGLSLRRAKQLIADVMAPDGLEQGEVGHEDWVKEIKAEVKEGKKPKPEDDED